ncbi:MAG: cadherin-like domain-containing protein, partial [Pseudomonadota bacterium]
SNGTLVLNSDGTFTYTPDADFTGVDTFVYEVSDGNGETAQATVTITVEPDADTPTTSFDPGSTTVNRISDPIELAINSTVGDEAGDNNLDGTPGVVYRDETVSVLDFGELFANVTVELTFNVTVEGSWNFDGAGGVYDDFWEVQVDGDPQARFFYNAEIIDDVSSPGGAGGSANALPGGGNDFSYGEPDTSVNRNMNFTHNTPGIEVTLDSMGQATVQFAGSTTQTSEIATINSAMVGLEIFTYEIPLEAALTDVDGSESLSLTLSGVPTGAALGAISVPAPFSLAETSPGSGEYEITGSDGLSIDTVLTLSVRAPAGSPPVFDMTLTAVATEADGGDTAISTDTISINGETVAPVALDLDGDGLEYLSRDAGVVFEDQFSGETLSTAWVAPDDGLLVYDANSSGSIDQVKEYVFTRWSDTAETDMQALAEVFDTDGNGVLDANDEGWSKFGVWQDLNSDGITDAGEFQSLDELGVESIALTYADDSGSRTDANGDVIVHGQSEVRWTDGQTSLAEDASFAIEAGDLLADDSEIPLPAGTEAAGAIEASSASSTIDEATSGGSTDSSSAAELAALEIDLLLRSQRDEKPDSGTVE